MWQRLVVLVFLLLSVSLAHAATTPTADFTDNNDGTVTHKTTGLTWKRCAEGQTWTGSACSGTAKTYTWAQANALSTGGWRLPRIDELVTIVEHDNYNPAINATIFPNTPTSSFWSASADAGYSDNAWGVLFGNGYDYSSSKTNAFQVRLVRGGQLLGSSGLYTPTSDFSDNGDGSVTHKKTSLTWKRCAEGMTWTGSTCSGTAKTYAWSAANSLSTSDWRLPTQNELKTLVEYSIAYPGPTINSTIFPNTPAYYFWSALAAADNSGDVWVVSFYNGHGGPDDRPLAFHIRLVRGDQSGTTPTTQRAKVTGVTVGEAIQTRPLSISVTGEALTSDLEVALDDCDNLQATGTPSATQRDYSCTPNSTGLLNGYVKAAPGERSLYNFSVTARDAQPTVVIAKVLPERAQLNKLTKFTVIGANLPGGLGFTVNDCEYSNVELAGGTATRRYFQCTPRGTIGSKTLLVKTKPGGGVLYQAPTEISEVVPDRDYVKPNVYGSSNALSLDADFNIADEDVGATGEYYIAANASGTWAFFDGKGWVVPQVAVARGALTDRRIPILKDLNVTQYKGIKIFAGYGRNISDMVSNKKYLLLKNLEKTALNDDVSELPDYALEAIEAIDDGSVTLALASTQVGFLRVGSVFLVGQSPRKVSSIVAQGARTVINTEDPTVADVLDKITVDTEINLSAQHFEAPSAPTITVSAVAEVDTRTGNDFAKIIESNTPTSYTYELKDHVIYDADGSSSSKLDQVIANGKIVIDKPKITAKVDYTTYGVSIAKVEVPKAVNLGFSAGQSIDITLSTGKFGFKNKKSIALGQFMVPVQAGLFVHVPIYLTFGAKGNASISASFSESSTLDIKMTAGFNPVKISGSANPSFNANANFTIQGTIGASVSLDPKVHLKFGNIALAGLENEIGFHAKARETIKDLKPCVDINVGGGLSSSAYVMVPDIAISWKKIEAGFAKKSVAIIDWESDWKYEARVPANCTL